MTQELQNRHADTVSRTSTDRSSDIEVIEHESDEETVQNESVTVRDMLLSDWDASHIDSDVPLDLSPGQKAYVHVPNTSVNFWLNLSVLVAVASVLGLGLGNYIGSYVNWAGRNAAKTIPSDHISHLQQLQQQLDDCLHDNEILLNVTAFNFHHQTTSVQTMSDEGPDLTRSESTTEVLSVRSSESSPESADEAHLQQPDLLTQGREVLVRKSSALSEYLPCFHR